MRILFLLSLLLIASFLFSETQPVVGICIIKDLKTPYKKSIIDSLKSRFPQVQFKQIPAKELFKAKKEDYQAVIVMDRLEAWTMFNRTLKKLSHRLNPAHTIYFITAGDPEWQWKKRGIITVTSASKKEQVSGVVNKISKELQLILSKK